MLWNRKASSWQLASEQEAEDTAMVSGRFFSNLVEIFQPNCWLFSTMFSTLVVFSLPIYGQFSYILKTVSSKAFESWVPQSKLVLRRQVIPPSLVLKRLFLRLIDRALLG